MWKKNQSIKDLIIHWINADLQTFLPFPTPAPSKKEKNVSKGSYKIQATLKLQEFFFHQLPFYYINTYEKWAYSNTLK